MVFSRYLRVSLSTLSRLCDKYHIIDFNLKFALDYFSCAVGSVLLHDEAKSSPSSVSNGGSDVAINMDGLDRQRYQQQLQLIDEQVAGVKSHCMDLCMDVFMYVGDK